MSEESPTGLTRLEKLQQAKEAALSYRLKEPDVIDGLRGPSEPIIPIEDIIPDPDVPSWLIESRKFKHPERVIIFQSKNPGLILSLKKSRVFFDADMVKQEEPGAMANFAKTDGFYATDDEELIAIIQNSPRYGTEFWDIQDAKKAAQEQNFQAFAADVADDPKLLERLVNENPEAIRQVFRKLGVKGGATFEEAAPPETPQEPVVDEKTKVIEPPKKGKGKPSDEGDDFE